MKTMAMATVTAVFGTSAWAEQPAATAAPVVTVCMDRSPDGPDYMVEGEASKIFSAISVTIVWRPRRQCQTSDAIRIRLTAARLRTLCRALWLRSALSGNLHRDLL